MAAKCLSTKQLPRTVSITFLLRSYCSVSCIRRVLGYVKEVKSNSVLVYYESDKEEIEHVLPCHDLRLATDAQPKQVAA